MRSLLITVLSVCIVGLCVGCAATGTVATPGATTQPLNAQTVALFANLALSDYQALESAGVIKSNLQADAAAAAIRTALNDFATAAPGTPQYQTVITALNDAGLQLATANAKAKATAGK